MPALLIATTLDFTPRDLTPLYLFAAAMAGLFVLIVLGRGIAHLHRRHVQQQTAWVTYQMVARTRGLTPEQTRAVAHLAKAGRLQRPSQVLASVRLFDRCLDRAEERGGLGENQLRLLQQARERLVTTAPTRDLHKERRNVERAECQMVVGVVEVAGEDLEQDISGQELSDTERVRRKLDDLSKDAVVEQGQIVDISAGGAAVVVREDLPVEESDYVGLRAGDGPTPVDLSGLWARVCSVQHDTDKGVMLLHLAFLPYEAETKRSIIRLVYQIIQPEAQTGPQATGPAAAAAPSAKPPGPLAGPGDKAPPTPGAKAPAPSAAGRRADRSGSRSAGPSASAP